jgi:hypothetical protein
MKRVDLIRHLERHGAQFLREGGNRQRLRESKEWKSLNSSPPSRD